MKTKLTPAQRSAVGIYVIESNACEDEPIAGITMHGGTLTMDMSADAAREILIDAINSADVGDGTTSDRGARTALENVLRKLG